MLLLAWVLLAGLGEVVEPDVRLADRVLVERSDGRRLIGTVVEWNDERVGIDEGDYVVTFRRADVAAVEVLQAGSARAREKLERRIEAARPNVATAGSGVGWASRKTMDAAPGRLDSYGLRLAFKPKRWPVDLVGGVLATTGTWSENLPRSQIDHFEADWGVRYTYRYRVAAAYAEAGATYGQTVVSLHTLSENVGKSDTGWGGFAGAGIGARVFGRVDLGIGARVASIDYDRFGSPDENSPFESGPDRVPNVIRTVETAVFAGIGW